MPTSLSPAALAAHGLGLCVFVALAAAQCLLLVRGMRRVVPGGRTARWRAADALAVLVMLLVDGLAGRVADGLLAPAGSVAIAAVVSPVQVAQGPHPGGPPFPFDDPRHATMTRAVSLNPAHEAPP